MSHNTKIIDMDPLFVIDPITRAITKESGSKTTVIQYDHNSEKFTFSLPREIEGHDMTECNRVEVHYLTNNGNSGIYEVTDLSVYPEDDSKVVCTWLLSQNATADTGVLSFLVRFSCVAEDGTVEYAWNTSIYAGISVQKGLYNAEAIVEENADILEQWSARLFSLSDEGVSNVNTARAKALSDITTAKNTALSDIETKGNLVNESIPDDYMTLSEKVNKVENDLNNIVDEIPSVNIFNTATAERGCFYSYISASGIVDKKENAYMTCVKQPIEGGKTYTCSRIDYGVYFLTENGELISNLNSMAETIQPFTFETPSDASYVCLSWKVANLAETQYMIVEGDELPTGYISYSEPYKKVKDTVKISSNSIVEETYTVALDGSGDYTSFSGCLLALKDNTNPKTIYVKAGTYDVFEEIGGADFCATIPSGTNWKDCSVLVPDNTKIIGVGMVELVFHPTKEQIGSVAGLLLSPINVMYNAEFENISIDSYNCRYAIHSDGRTDKDAPIRQVYRNVRIKHRYVETGHVAGFGAGTRNANNYIFENCVFDAWQPLSYHNNGEYTLDGTQIIFNNCIFKAVYPSERPCIKFGNVNPNQTRIDVRLSGCYLNGNIKIINETTGLERPNAFAIEALNCSNFNTEITVATNIYEPVIYNF